MWKIALKKVAQNVAKKFARASKSSQNRQFQPNLVGHLEIESENSSQNNQNEHNKLYFSGTKVLILIRKVSSLKIPEPVFVVMCDPPMNELWAT